MFRTVQAKLFVGMGVVLLGFLILSLTSIEVLTRRYADAGIQRELGAARLAATRVLELRQEVLNGQARAAARAPYLKATLTIEGLDASTAFEAVRQLTEVADPPLLLLLDHRGILLADGSNSGASAMSLADAPGVSSTLEGIEVGAMWTYRDRAYLVSACPVLSGDLVVGVVVVGVGLDDALASDIRQVTGAEVLLVQQGRTIGEARDSAGHAVGTETAWLMEALDPRNDASGAQRIVTVPARPDQHAIAVPLDGGITLVLVRSLADFLLLHRQQRTWLVLVSLACGLIAVLASRVVAVRLGRPIAALTSASEAFGEGNLSVSVPESGHDELSALSAGFNRMTSRIARLVAEVRAHAAVLQAQQEQLVDARIAADAANRSKSAFLANMSHELRTPLNAIVGYSELLIDEAEDRNAPEFAPDLQKILRSGRHLLSLVNDVLDFSRVEVGKVVLEIDEFDLGALLEDTVAMVEPLATKNANTLRLDGADAAGSVVADGRRLRQVLYNLLSNACKFTRNGEVRLSVRRHVENETEYVSMIVADNGIGISAQDLGRLFQPFTQVDSSTTRRYEGTGLGLAISRGYCQLMGGTITVTSAPGCGSVFTATVKARVPSSSIDEIASAA